jgi:photosystem II stability/assembly factor-like uncharacterized protein
MKKNIILIIFLFFIAGGIFTYSFLRNDSRNINEKTQGENEGHPKMEQVFFSEWHSPYPAYLEQTTLDKIWDDVSKIPDEKNLFDNSLSQWENIGPFGNNILSANDVKFSGRVRDIRIINSGSIMITAATGGLWKQEANTNISLSDAVTSLSSSSFDIMPGNPNIIVLGTGEPFRKNGTGLWRTADGGGNWTRTPMAGDYPSSFYKIRFIGQNIVHAAAKSGYYRSNDAGLTWTKFISAEITDVIINPLNPDIVYCGYWDNSSNNGGAYKSTNGGTNWTRISNLPTSNVGRVFISLSKINPNIMYVLMTKDSDDTFLAFYRTLDGGSTWTSIAPNTGGDDFFDGIGWYLGSLGVSPTNPLTVLAGGLWLWRTTDGGSSWNKITDITDKSIHADQHAVEWSNDGSTVYVGHDGGTSVSTNQGATFITTQNTWPITQYYNFDISQMNPNIIFGGCQDNGLTGTTDGGITWKYSYPGAGDGSGVAIHPVSPSTIFGTLGFFGNSWLFNRLRTTNYGNTWAQVNSGVEPSSQSYNKIRVNNTSPVSVYSNVNKNLYYSTNNGDNWSKRNAAEFPFGISNFSVRTYNNVTCIYVCLADTNSGQRLRMQIGSNDFMERSNGIPGGLSIRTVSMHPTNSKIAYAVINGLSAGNKIFKTKDNGANWVNISGNLPNVPVADVVMHDKKDNILYAGTEMGCYKTIDGGTAWFRWNDGMPDANIITEMKSYRTSQDQFYVIASSYGRGFWKRPESTPLGGTSFVPENFKLYQNYPNPFNPTTIITYDISLPGFVSLKLYDVTGREINTLINEQMDAGEYIYELNAAGLSSGIYFYSLTVGNFIETKRMLLLK